MKLELLRRVPTFARLAEEQLALLGTHLGQRSFLRGETIFHQGSEGNTLYIISQGQVRIFVTSGTGQELSVGIFSAGEFFGELSLLDEQPRSATAVAMTATHTLTLHRTAFLQTLNACPAIAVAVLEALSTRLRQSNNYAEYLASHSAAQRVVRRLLDLADHHGVNDGDTTRIDLHLTQDDLASLAGTTRETVNRVLGGLREQGLIKIERGQMSVLNLARLEELG